MGTRLISVGLSSSIEVDRSSSSVVRESNEEFDLDLIDGMGEEMMQLIVEAATLKLTPKRGIDASSGEMML